jgi:hypothetical protein
MKPEFRGRAETIFEHEKRSTRDTSFDTRRGDHTLEQVHNFAVIAVKFVKPVSKEAELGRNPILF